MPHTLKLTVIYTIDPKNDFIESTTQIDGLIEHLCFYFVEWRTNRNNLWIFLILFPFIIKHTKGLSISFSYSSFFLFKRPPILYLILNFLLCFHVGILQGEIQGVCIYFVWKEFFWMQQQHCCLGFFIDFNGANKHVLL